MARTHPTQGRPDPSTRAPAATRLRHHVLAWALAVYALALAVILASAMSPLC